MRERNGTVPTEQALNRFQALALKVRVQLVVEAIGGEVTKESKHNHKKDRQGNDRQPTKIN